MTLIAAILDGAGRFIAFSDGLVSMRRLDGEFVTPLGDKESPSVGTGLHRKSWLLGNHAVLWSGSVRQARKVYNSTKLMSLAKYEDMVDRILSLDWGALDDLSLIYLHNDGAKIRIAAFDCYMGHHDGDTIVASGSGSGDMTYSDHQYHSSSLTGVPGNYLEAFTKYLGELTQREWMEARFSEKKYGAWYEIIVPNTLGGFDRPDMRVNVHYIEPDFNTGGPISISWSSSLRNRPLEISSFKVDKIDPAAREIFGEMYLYRYLDFQYSSLAKKMRVRPPPSLTFDVFFVGGDFFGVSHSEKDLCPIEVNDDGPFTVQLGAEYREWVRSLRDRLLKQS